MEIKLASDLTEEELQVIERMKKRRDSVKKEVALLKAEITRVKKQLDALESSDGVDSAPDEEEMKARQFRSGIKQFNVDANKGMKFLLEKGHLPKEADAVASFFLNTPTLAKNAIGAYLGENKEFNLEVLHSFVLQQNYAQLSFERALRKYLSTFRLPGEAQKIDRMMEEFAAQYHDQNPNSPFLSKDTVYVLAFSTIMLNTDQHNPAVKNPMTKEGFIKNNSKINEGQDLPVAMLTEIYDHIQKEEIAMPKNEDGNDFSQAFFNPEREGYLTKQGGRRKNWKRRYFILTGNCLYYFKDKDKDDSAPCGIVPLTSLSVRETQNKRPYCFEIYNPYDGMIKACKTASDGTVVEGRHSVYIISASSDAEREDWIQAIRASITQDPFYEIVNARRNKLKGVDG